MNTPHLLEVVFGQVTQANSLKEVFLPTLFTVVNTDGNVSLLTDGATKASGLIASSQVRKGIAQIVKLATGKLLSGHVVLEPKNLGDFHFNAHLATDIFKKLVLGAVDQFRLLNGAVVEPQDNVAVVAIVGKVRTGDGYRLIGVGRENGERASRIEANTFNEAWVNVGLTHNSADTLADALPNVCGGLLL